MKDVVAGKGLDIYHPSAGGSSVDLGGFKQVRHGNNSETAVTVKLQLELTDSQGRCRKLQSVSTFAGCPPPADYVRRLRALIAERFADILTRNSFESLLGKATALEYAVIEHSLKTLLERDHGKFTLERLLTDCHEGNEAQTTSWDKLRRAKCPKLSTLCPSLLEELFSAVVPAFSADDFTRDQILRELQDLAVAVLEALKLQPPPATEAKPSLVRFELSEDGPTNLLVERNAGNVLMIHHLNASWLAGFHGGNNPNAPSFVSEDYLGRAAEGFAFNNRDSWIPREPLFLTIPDDRDGAAARKRLAEYLIGTPELPGLLSLCQSAAEKQCESLGYLGPLRAYPARDMAVADLPQTMDPEGLFAWRLLYERDDVRTAVSEWLTQPLVTPGYEITVDRRIELDVVATKIADELTRIISGVQHNITDLRAMNETSGWSGVNDDALYTAYETFEAGDLQVCVSEAIQSAKAQMASQSSGIVYLKDRRTGKRVTSRDIGVGMSQLIPVLVHAMAAQGELIAIEQPEIHIHPALQAELGDVFIESALKQGNTFLIETHSEHLILRIMRRIRETARGKLPAGKQPIRPEDVCILYVEPSESGSIVREMPINEQGELVKLLCPTPTPTSPR